MLEKKFFPSGFRFKPDIFKPDRNPDQNRYNPDIRKKKIRFDPDGPNTDRRATLKKK